MIRLLVIDDHPAFHAAVDLLCEVDGEMEVAAHAASMSEGLAALATHPDLVVLDVNLGGIDGMTGARMILDQTENLPIVLCSTAALSELPPPPLDPCVTFVPKAELDAQALHNWFHNRSDRPR